MQRVLYAVAAWLLLLAPGDAARLRFQQDPQVPGLYRAVADCLIVIGKTTYGTGKCRVATVAGSNDVEIYYDAKPGENAEPGNAVIKTDRSQTIGMWSGPTGGLQRPDDLLGALVREGDCWLNKTTRICVYGRVASTLGRCLLSVKGRTYVDGNCPIESYTPSGDFYINANCHAVSKYSARVAVGSDGTAQASWTGDPPGAHADVPLGRLKRDGACWANDDARLCAYRGKADSVICAPETQPIPDGHSEPLTDTLLYTPQGRCEWDFKGRSKFSGACGVAADNNDDVKLSGAPAGRADRIKITTSDGVTTIAWNGGDGDTYRDELGTFERQGKCWISASRGSVCVNAPTLEMTRDTAGDTHWNIVNGAAR